jgi:hypothetical protein
MNYLGINTFRSPCGEKLPYRETADAFSQPIDQRSNARCVEFIVDVDHRDVRRAGIKHPQQRGHTTKGRDPSFARRAREDVRGK